jgi:hypothetical protein
VRTEDGGTHGWRVTEGREGGGGRHGWRMLVHEPGAGSRERGVRMMDQFRGFF